MDAASRPEQSDLGCAKTGGCFAPLVLMTTRVENGYVPRHVQNNSPGTCTENIFTTTDFALYFGDIFNGWSHLENKLNETKFLFSKKNCKNV